MSLLTTLPQVKYDEIEAIKLLNFATDLKFHSLTRIHLTCIKRQCELVANILDHVLNHREVTKDD